MRYLITGGAGYLGSALVTELAKSKKNQIYVLDNFHHGQYDEISKSNNIEEYLVANIKDFSSITRLIDRSRPDVVIHLAAFITRPETLGQFRVCAEINHLGTANLLEACLREGHKPKKIILASSEAVRNPTSHYGISKLAAEGLLESVCPLTGIHLGILRFSEIYGPSKVNSSKCMVNFLVDNMLAGQSVAIFDVDRQKDYLHISDAVRALKLAIKCPEPIFNVDIGSGEPVRTKDLIEKLKKLIDFEGDFGYFEHSTVRVYDSIANTLPAKELLGFECRADFDKELKSFISKRKKAYLRE